MQLFGEFGGVGYIWVFMAFVYRKAYSLDVWILWRNFLGLRLQGHDLNSVGSGFGHITIPYLHSLLFCNSKLESIKI